MIGKTISHYKIVDKLGEGGMGAVYKAEDTTLGRLVAIKALSTQLAEDEEARERFIREAQAASALNHPNIITVHDLLDSEDQHFICMEYVEGKTIRDILESGHVSIRKAVDIILQAAEALDAAHRKGILHRDVKSANIMVSMEGNVKVMDFGLAYLEERSQLTRTGTTMGTLAYSSPEQLTGRPYDERCEIWSLGVVFYELLTGQLPFKSPSEGELIFTIINTEQDRPSKLREDVPESVEAVVTRMLEKDTELRYSTCSELIRDLNTIRGELETSTVSISGTLVSPHTRFKRRSIMVPVAIGAAAIGVIAIILLARTTKQIDKPCLVVLPFTNIGAAEDDWFVNSFTGQIRDQLTGINSLDVISQRSSAQFKDASTAQIGDELHVQFILTGTLHWRKQETGQDDLQITSELIHVSGDARLWSESFQESFSQIIHIQHQIANRVVEKLQVEIAAPERRSLAEKPTGNTDAYRAYLRGRHYARLSGTEENCKITALMFQRAVELDPDFALAWGELAQAHARLYHWGWDLTPNRRAMAREAAQRAISFDTDTPEMHRCFGYYYYWAYKDYQKALDELLLAEAELPSNAEVVEGLALVLRRMGKFDEALDKYLKAFELSPLEARLPTEIGNTYIGLRQYPEALYFFDKAVELSPDDPFPYVYKAILLTTGEGLPDEAREAMSNVPSIVDPYITWAWFMVETTSGNFERALEIISSYPLDYIAVQGAFYPIALLKSIIHRQMGQLERARTECEEALIILEREKVRRPQDPRVRSALGLAYAGLGRKEEAIREGRYVIDELYPLSLDALAGPAYIFDMAHIYVVAEEYEAAIEQLEVLLSVPNAISARYLEISPFFAPLRDHPRFQELLKKYN